MSSSTGAGWTWAREGAWPVSFPKKGKVVSREGRKHLQWPQKERPGIPGGAKWVPVVTVQMSTPPPLFGGDPAWGLLILMAFLGLGHPAGLCTHSCNGFIARFLYSVHKEGLRPAWMSALLFPLQLWGRHVTSPAELGPGDVSRA